MVVDQPATIGALAVAVAQDMGITVGYLPGLSMRRIADLAPGSATTDARDAAVITGAARSMPHTLRAVSASDEDVAALSMLTGFDLDLARQVNQSANRIRGLYTQIHPALEAVVGPWPGARRRPGGPSPPGQGPPGTGAHLASYAGPAPVTRTSGSSIRGEVRLPRRQQETQTHHVPVHLRLHVLRPGIEGTLPAEMKLGTAVWPGQARPSLQTTSTYRDVTNGFGRLKLNI